MEAENAVQADPLEVVTKDLQLLKEAQNDLKKLDVLVCGGCHQTFHEVEAFQSHKPECSNESTIRLQKDEKPQVWGYTLWKTKQNKELKEKDEPLPSSWETYQKWTKLDQWEKDAWVSAGQNLQFYHKIGLAKIETLKVKEGVKSEKDPLALDDGFQPAENVKTAMRTAHKDREEYNVEKIVSKRFNPKKRFWEYEVKWENYEAKTWEPLAHLENCKALVQEYESVVKAEKEKQSPGAGRGRGRPRVNALSPEGTPIKVVQKKPVVIDTSLLITSSEGRPQRTSKQKALNQVKQWCGNISDGEEASYKRPFDDDDSDDSFEKRIKLEGESEDTEEDEPKHQRKVAKIVHTYHNGSPKKLPDNILIPDAKGVVRISQKQLPSLSSGVYIMSKSSGIIKLDPTASKIATSGGQAIVKVSPKIGQTQIRIIKRDEKKTIAQSTTPAKGGATPVKMAAPVKTSTPVKVTVKASPAGKPAVKPLQPIAPKLVQTKSGEKVVKKVPVKIVDSKAVGKEKVVEEESDDGVEELEFPTDIPLPTPDSPPSEFVLDPTTGKIAGQEYPDPEPEPVVSDVKKETAADTLENIVKLAAADITEDDLKTDPEPLTILEPEATTSTTVEPEVATAATTTVEAAVSPTVVTTTAAAPTVVTATAAVAPTVVTTVVSRTSTAGTAFSNSNILQKTLMSPRPKQKPPPRVINQTVASKSRTVVTSVIRNSTPKPVPTRTKPSILPKPKFNVAPVRSPLNRPAQYKPPLRKVGETTITRTPVRRSPMKVPSSTPRHFTTSRQVTSQRQVATSRQVISMPSLDDVEPSTSSLKSSKINNDVVHTEIPAFALATASDRPMIITGDDGTIYQIAGQNEDGQTILVTQDSNGQQQCLLVTGEALQEETQQAESQVMMEVEEPMEIEGEPLVAQFIRSEPPSPGGTHKVVVMLPDGNVMVTQVTREEYASLELDK